MRVAETIFAFGFRTFLVYQCVGCPTNYQTRQFFNNSKTDEDIATRFEQEYVRCVRNEKECVCSKIMSVCVCSKIIKELPGLVGSGTTCSMWRVAILQ